MIFREKSRRGIGDSFGHFTRSPVLR
jgi:hypothetical protein